MVDLSDCTKHELNANTRDKEKMFRGQYCKCDLYVAKITQFHNTTTIRVTNWFIYVSLVVLLKQITLKASSHPFSFYKYNNK